MKSILVTGGHQSQAICERLLSDYPDTCIWLGSRDVKLGKDAREAIIEALGDEMRRRIQVVAMDTTLDSSVQVMAERLRLGGQKLYGIVHNAGIGFGHTFEDAMQANYFGPRRVNDAFIPLLQKGGRIVHISSGAPMDVPLASPYTVRDLDRLAHTEMPCDDPYGPSNALLLAYTGLLAQEHPELVVNACTPGVKTEQAVLSAPCVLLMDPSVEELPQGRYYRSDSLRSPDRAPVAVAFESRTGAQCVQ